MRASSRLTAGQHLLLVAAWMVLAASTGVVVSAAPDQNLEGCVESFDPMVDYFPEKIRLRHAQGFRVEYFRHYKVVTVLAPWPGAEAALRYVLVQCGTPAPDGFEADQVISVPIRSLVSLVTAHLPHLEVLDRAESLVAVASIGLVNSATVHRRFDQGKVAEVGHGASLDIERILDLAPDLVMTDAAARAGYNSHPALLRAGIPVAIASEYAESSMLGRTEWLLFTAAFFNRERLAREKFERVVEEYERYAELTRNVPAAARPTAFGGALWGDVWRVAGGQSFPAQLLKDAGARYLWADMDSPGATPLDFEAVFERAHDADFWFPARSDWLTRVEVLADDERYGSFAALVAGRVYNMNGRLNGTGGNDYWETGIVEPHVVLADFIRVLHPDLLPKHRLKYLRHLE